MKITRLSALLLLLTLVGCGGGQSSQYDIVDLGTLPGGYPTEGVAINADGLVVGKSAGRTREGKYFERRAFLWQSGVIRDLGALGGLRSEAAAISTSGIMVGAADVDDLSFGQAFIHDGYAMRPLSVPPGTVYSMAHGINDFGVVVGEVNYRPVLWTHGVMTDIALLPGHDEGTANGINSAGHIAGMSMKETGGNGGNRATARSHRAGDPPMSAFLAVNGQTTALPTLGGLTSYANAINDHDWVVGYAETVSGDSHACLWANGKAIDLGTLGGKYSTALAVGVTGQIVGQSDMSYNDESGLTARHAMLYTNGKMHDLNDMIPTGAGWVLNTASGINDRGQIVGSGIITGSFPTIHAFLLTPHR